MFMCYTGIDGKDGENEKLMSAEMITKNVPVIINFTVVGSIQYVYMYSMRSYLCRTLLPVNTGM